MTLDRKSLMLLVAIVALGEGTNPARGEGLPAWLPRYEVTLDLDLDHHEAHVHLEATWTNPARVSVKEVVFNAHARYTVPKGKGGLMAKTLEILRLNPGDAMGDKEPALQVQKVFLLSPPAGTGKGQAFVPVELQPYYEGDTDTTLRVPLPQAVGPGESVTVALEIRIHLPQKQGRWGQWGGVTYLSNWLPVFAFFGEENSGPLPECDEPAPAKAPHWQPTPFVPWHQPFFNESAHYHVRATLPCDQEVACSGTILGCSPLGDGRKGVEIRADGVRDFAFLCSSRYRLCEGEVPVGPGVPAPVRVHVLAFPEHAYYAREMVRIATEAIQTYARWFGPYPYPDYTIAESFFGWNGNECSTLVMIDERIFAMPHLGLGYVDYLVSHETCHQWWYNVVGTNGYCETWMDEALATYFSNRLLNAKVGKNNDLMTYPKGLEWLPNIRREDYRSYGLYGTLGRGENGPIIRDMPDFQHLITLFSMCYDKGSRVVGMIEDRLGPDAFLDFMRRIYARYQFRILRVADFERELEEYTGARWRAFFRDWLYGTGLTDWAVAKVEVQPHCLACRKCWLGRFVRHATGKPRLEEDPCKTRVTVILEQREAISEQTVLGIGLPGCPGYPIRIPILPRAEAYQLDDPPARVEPVGKNCWRVEVLLPEEPEQIAVDPDQVLVDKDPSNNFWKMPVRWRVTPLYTFLEETDLTNSYDRWNFIFGPWIFATAYDDVWYPRSPMLGLRAGAYRTQEFSGGVFTAYRTDYRDVVVGADGLLDHWPDSHYQVGFNFERRLTTTYQGDNNAERGVLFGRYIFLYGDSLYLQPSHYVEAFTAYQENFLPFVRQAPPNGERFDQTTTAGLHYRLNYLTPYWDPEGGFLLDGVYEGGMTELGKREGLNEIQGQFATVAYLPDLSQYVEPIPKLHALLRPALEWFADTRVAVRLYGATGWPSQGEFFSLGGSTAFRGFDLAQRQGNTVWVGSLEWWVPLAKDLHVDFFDHVVGLRNVYGAAFYDVGDCYTDGRSVGPVAHGVGASLRLDFAWFSFVERTTLRLDVAKSVNTNTGVQFWFGVQPSF